MMCETAAKRTEGMEGNAAVCQNSGEKRVLDVCAQLFGGFSDTVR